ncbi:head decoration protein [Novosphingobium piscinae]|uniref:Head decoration protein n=1 Tax=Novosphingobium piscinae TaxID=1507448 RepID=A0A7X1FZE3_9SPHN|nr:head decoration protein [Novosphingobium piscinae]MBC2669654.1 head decoration protein [Novosphingobium piscinae]
MTATPGDWEFLSHGARDNLVLIAGQNLRAGTVLGRISASGLFTILAPAAADGSQNAAAILGQATDATGGNRSTSGLRTGPAEVLGNRLLWPAGITTPQRNAAISALAALGIKLR